MAHKQAVHRWRLRALRVSIDLRGSALGSVFPDENSSGIELQGLESLIKAPLQGGGPRFEPSCAQPAKPSISGARGRLVRGPLLLFSAFLSIFRFSGVRFRVRFLGRC